MTGIDGGALRAWRRSRGWAVPEMAQQLRRAAREASVSVAAHDGLIRMIYAWERGDHDLSERYELLYVKLGWPGGGRRAAQGDDEPMRRRHDFLALAGVAAAGTLAASATAAAHPVSPPALTAPSADSWAKPVYDAVLSPVDAVRRAEADGRMHLASLRRAVAAAMQASLASDYALLAKTVPDLIGRAELAGMKADGGSKRDLWQLLSDMYAIAAWTLIKADCPAAAWASAQRSLQLAEQAGDVLRSAAATRCLSEVHMRANSFEEASRTAFLAATYLDTARIRHRSVVLCLRGAALLSASAAAARRGDGREAQTSLKAAGVFADELGQDRADLGTVFGPTNVAIHKVAVAVELGDPGQAVRHVPEVRLDQMPTHLTERRARFLIDVARSHAGVQDDRAAISALAQAEQIAPDELRNHRLTRAVLADLLTRERRSSGLRALAVRCHALA